MRAGENACHWFCPYPVRFVHQQFIIDLMVAAGNWKHLLMNGTGLGPLASFFLILLDFCDDNRNHNHNQDKHDKDHIWKPHVILLWLFGTVVDHSFIAKCHSIMINPLWVLSTIIVWISLKVNAIFAASWRRKGFGWSVLHLHSSPLNGEFILSINALPPFPFP